ncbi:Lipopolysaccharide export system protein LptC [Candidatus Hartigia pinicola]|nr:Lipopolysaccharide export system protein LptC [Candidatus Hartigia pinicola]
MRNTKKWLVILMSFGMLGLIGWNLSGYNTETFTDHVINKREPNYHTDNAVTFIYNPFGELSYQLVSDNIDNYTTEKVTWFTNPVLTIYNNVGIPAWIMKSRKAKLMNNKVLYLYNNVQVDNLGAELQIQRILTQNAIINLITQDILSDDKVTIIGQGLNSTGLKMRGNFRTRSTELIEDIKTYYVLQKKREKK